MMMNQKNKHKVVVSWCLTAHRHNNGHVEPVIPWSGPILKIGHLGQRLITLQGGDMMNDDEPKKQTQSCC